jgi:polyisoprenoid-binding protein YceI
MTWKLDNAHSKIGFTVRHMMISKVHGEFKDFEVDLNLDPANPENSQITATIDAASINTNQSDRDNHLRSADFFDAEEHPKLKFESTSLRKTGDGEVELAGNLTIRGVTRPITLKGEQLGPVKNPLSQAETVGYTLSGELNREDYGLTWNQAMETGGVMVSKKINIVIEVEVVNEG